MSVGKELKHAREQARLSPEQISERTKIQLYKIDALENDDFELLPQGIYLDGIVRAYAQHVGIDPDPMVERVRLERGKLPGDWEIPFAVPIDLHGGASAPPDVQVIDVPELHDPLGSFAAEGDAAHVPAAQAATHKPRVPHVPHKPQLLHAPLAAHVPHVPPASARPARGRGWLALPVLLLLAAAGWGVYVYDSNRRLEGDATADATTVAPSAATNDMMAPRATAAPRDAQPVDRPALFGESASAIAIPSAADRLEPDNPSNSSASAAAETASASVAPTLSAPATPPARPGSDTTPGSAPRNRPSELRISADASALPASVGTAGSGAQNVSGAWTFATQVESTGYSPDAGLKLGYEMKLEQDGDRVTGVGRKVTENGSGIDATSQTPLTVNGSIAGDRLTLTFIERGSVRPTHGKFVLLVEEDGTLRGRFSSTATRSSGLAEARRLAVAQK